MKVTMFGRHLCKDALYAIYKLQEMGADLEFKNISASLADMKEFLAVRDNCTLFDEAKANGYIGIPYFEAEDGTKTLDLQEILKKL